MTAPALAFGVRGRGRHYPFPPDDPSDWPRNRWGSVDPETLTTEAYPSVTNILGVVGKDGLKYWAAEMALRELYDSGSLPLSVDQAIQDHKFACNRVASKRADAGTRAHSIAEALTADLPLPLSISDEDAAYADAFLSFWADYSPEVISVETTLYGDGYAGTADLIATLRGGFTVGPVVVDYKTRGERDDKKIARYGLLYDENRMQLAALARAHSAAVANGAGWTLEDRTNIWVAMGVVLFPDGSYDTEIIEDPQLDRWYSAFRGALELWKGLKAA